MLEYAINGRRVSGGPKPNSHTPGQGAPNICKLLLLPPGGRNVKFRLRNPRVLLALVQTLLTCVFQLKGVRRI